MDTRFLQSFVSVVEHGSIAAAARHLQISPTALTQRIQALESALGCKLIVRSGRTVKPTAAGTRVLRRAAVVLRDIRDLRSAASDSELPAGPLRLGTIPSAGIGILPAMMREWSQRYSHIEIHIETGSSLVLYGKVLSGDLDAAVLVHPLFDLPKSCDWRCLREEPLILLTPAAMRVENPLKVISREPFIRPDRNMVAGKLAEDYLRRHGVHPKVRFELNGIDMVAGMVAAGCGVSIMPDCPVLGFTEETLKRWPLPEPCPSRSVGLLWQRSGTRCPLAEAFVALAAQSSKDQGARSRSAVRPRRPRAR